MARPACAAAARLALAALLLLALLPAHTGVVSARALPDVRSKRDLPGWGAEKGRGRAADADVRRRLGDDGDAPAPAPKVTFLSWDPRIILVSNFLNASEAAHIIALAENKMQRSSVVDNASGGSVVDQIRTSSGTFLEPNQDGVLAAIQLRIAELSMLPVENQEAMQVLHYGLKEKYGAHMDTFFDSRHTGEENGGQRIATALTFLNEPLEGGETVFPNVAARNEGPQWSECARDALAHKPRMGDLILFWSLTPSGDIDMGATHTACPVIRGEKWSAPLWIRQSAFQPNARHATAAPNGERRMAGDACVDLHTECAAWAASGECKSNPSYMIGDLGQCRVSCKACPYPKALR